MRNGIIQSNEIIYRNRKYSSSTGFEWPDNTCCIDFAEEVKQTLMNGVTYDITVNEPKGLTLIEGGGHLLTIKNQTFFMKFNSEGYFVRKCNPRKHKIFGLEKYFIHDACYKIVCGMSTHFKHIDIILLDQVISSDFYGTVKKSQASHPIPHLQILSDGDVLDLNKKIIIESCT